MIEDHYAKYPRLKQFVEERDDILTEDIIGPCPAAVRSQQERAVALIARHGAGTDEEKEAAMICALLVLDPPSLFYDLPRLFLDYGEQVEFAVEQLMGAPGDMAMSPVVAEARTASGIVIMEDMTRKIENGEPLEAAPAAIRDGMQKAFGQDDHAFSAMRSVALLSRFRFAREKVLAQLDGLIAAEEPEQNPQKPKFRPGGGDFSL